MRQLKHNLPNGKQHWRHARRHWMKERKQWVTGKKPSQGPEPFRPTFSRASRLSTPSRRKLKEKKEYNSFLPNFRPLSATALCGIPKRKNRRQLEIEPRNYNAVSKKHGAGR